MPADVLRVRRERLCLLRRRAGDRCGDELCHLRVGVAADVRCCAGVVQRLAGGQEVRPVDPAAPPFWAVHLHAGWSGRHGAAADATLAKICVVSEMWMPTFPACAARSSISPWVESEPDT